MTSGPGHRKPHPGSGGRASHRPGCTGHCLPHRVGQWTASPTSVTTLGAGNARDLLEHAFTVLNVHGITAVPAFGADPETARAVIRQAVRDTFPFGTGAYVFWTATDDASFRADGTLGRPISLHYSEPAVGVAVEATVRQMGLNTGGGPDLTLQIDGAAPAS
ncbi:MAG: hypothetical protein ABJA16_00195 [Nakamurella sp.]